MQGMLISYVILLATFFTVISTNIVSADDASIKASEEQVRYQEVFFQFYRKDEYNALVNLKAGLQEKKIIENKFSNELLLGNLYSMYGLDEFAGRSLKFVATQSPSKKQQVLAWFYLSKQHFDNEDFERFYHTSKRIKRGLPQRLREEKRYMEGMYFIHTRALKKAENLLDKMRENLDWYNYLKFNLGITYLGKGANVSSKTPKLSEAMKRQIKIKKKHVNKGLAFLHDVAEGKFASEDMLALKDKTNIVLGYYYIRAEKPKNAISTFENVRLNSPFSKKALLGLGWAYSQQQRFRKALVPWSALANKNTLDTAVQEAKLAVAFAYRQLGAEKKSLALYKSTIDSYQSVKKQYSNEMANSLIHNVFSPLVADKRLDDYGITQNLTRLFMTQEKSILIDLLKTESFQIMFNDYRDLKQLQDKLTVWSQDLERMSITLSFQTSAEQSMMPNDNELARKSKHNGNVSESSKNYKEHLATLSGTVQLQHDRMDIMLGMYEERIRDAFIENINTRQQYLTAYLSQARFGLAETLDKAQKNNE